MMKVIYLFLLILGMSVAAQAQSRKNNQNAKGDSYNYPSTYNAMPSRKETKNARKAYKNSYARQFDVKIKEYEERMQANAKKYEEMAKEAEKPQYSDPTYFGHKHKPKKRKPGHKKFCKECEIWH